MPSFEEWAKQVRENLGYWRHRCPAQVTHPDHTLICILDKGHHFNHVDPLYNRWFILFDSDAVILDRTRPNNGQ